MNIKEMQKFSRRFGKLLSEYYGLEPLKPGAKYARANYESIKKLLPRAGTVAAAVREFDSDLTEKENRSVSKAIQRMLDADKIYPPYREDNV